MMKDDEVRMNLVVLEAVALLLNVFYYHPCRSRDVLLPCGHDCIHLAPLVAVRFLLLMIRHRVLLTCGVEHDLLGILLALSSNAIVVDRHNFEAHPP